MQNLEEAAKAFAFAAHAGQVRKYTADPYICHPAHVVGILKGVGIVHPPALAAGWLHDTVEDNKDIELGMVRMLFGSEVAGFVDELTDLQTPADGNRATRKARYKARIAEGSYYGKAVKLADLISNTESITEHDPDFARVYMREKRDLLEVLTEGHPSLFQKAKSIVDGYFNQMVA